ncbi:MAG: DUF4410 domain-containing protein [Rhodospirillales bacterium]|nr:DUF4410 domain-containing protein [Rhodospirillales bacterium]
MRRYRRALVFELVELKAFDSVLTTAPTPLPAGAVMFTGAFTDVRDGSEALRFLIGSGLGEPYAEGQFQIDDASGTELAAFSEEVRGFGGTGSSAQWNPIYVDDVIDNFARLTATAIVRWTRGKDLEPSMWSYIW